MASVNFLHNESNHLGSFLKTQLNAAQKTRITVAYLKHSGLQLIDDALVTNLKGGGSIQFLVGLGFGMTDKESLLRLLTLSKQFPRFEGKVFTGGEYDTAEFHPKLYYFASQDRAGAIVGSSNLTKGGLETNVEALVWVSDNHESGFMKQLVEYLDDLWDDPQSTTLTPEIVSAYEPMVWSRSKSDEAVATSWRQVSTGITSVTASQVGSVMTLACRLIPTIMPKDRGMSVPEIYEMVKNRLPELCNDDVMCPHEPDSKRPEWQHQVRWAILTLKKEKRIARVEFNSYVLA